MSRARAPAWFTIAAVLLLLWVAAGVFACLRQWQLGAEAMGPSDAYYRALYTSFPAWYNPVYSVATGAGLLGAVALLARHRAAGVLFAVSLVAIVVQFGWLFATTDMIAVRGPAATVPAPVLIAAISASGVWLARHARRRGWIG